MEVKRVFKCFNRDLIQFPINVFNQTFLKKSFLSQLSKKGIELHARSIFFKDFYFKKSTPLFFT